MTYMFFNQLIRFLFIVFIFGIQTIWGQSRDADNQRYRYVSTRWHTGEHLYTGGETTEALLNHGYGAVEIKLGWQTTQKHEWARYLSYPSYGVGFYVGTVGDPAIFGRPRGLFSFVNFPITDDRERNVFNIEPSLGLTYLAKAFDKEKNPHNDAIGARLSVYFSLRFGYNYKINRDLDLEYGVDFTHFSNGRTFTPNHGLNMIGVHIGMKYNYNRDQMKVNKDLYKLDSLLPIRYLRPDKLPSYKVDSPHSVNVYAAAGTVQTDADAGLSRRYTTFSGVMDYQYEINNIHQITAGMDYFYDGSLDQDFPDDSKKWHHIGVHLGYGFAFYKFTVIGQIGTYLNANPTKSKVFIRPALRYSIGKKTFLQLGLKTNGGAADWVELGVGFRPFKW